MLLDALPQLRKALRLPFPHHRDGDVGACVGIRQCVVMMREIVAAMEGDGVQLMVGQLRIELAREAAGAVKAVARIGEVECLVRRAEAAFVEGAVVRHERQPFQTGRNRRPCLVERGCVGGIACRQSVHRRRPSGVIIRIGTDELVNRVLNPPVRDNRNPDAANAAPLAVGGFEVNSGEARQLFIIHHYSISPKIQLTQEMTVEALRI